jgi:hypothetical protein
VTLSLQRRMKHSNYQKFWQNHCTFTEGRLGLWDLYGMTIFVEQSLGRLKGECIESFWSGIFSCGSTPLLTNNDHSRNLLWILFATVPNSRINTWESWFIFHLQRNNCSRSRRRAAKADKRKVLVHTHGLFIT